MFSRHRFNSGPSTGKWMASERGVEGIDRIDTANISVLVLHLVA